MQYQIIERQQHVAVTTILHQFESDSDVNAQTESEKWLGEQYYLSRLKLVRVLVGCYTKVLVATVYYDMDINEATSVTHLMKQGVSNEE